MRRIVGALLAAALGCATTVVLARPASAGDHGTGQQELISTTENLWRVSYVEENTGCGTPEFFVTATINGDPVEPLHQQVESARSIIVTMPPEGPAGTMAFVLRCGSATTPTDEEYGILTVDKVVTGQAPPDASFRVRVACGANLLGAATFGGEAVEPSQNDDPFVAEVGYGRDGGRAYVYSDRPRVCDVTETGTAGATSTTVDPATVEFDAPTDFSVTVTNTYAPAAIELLPTFTG